MPRVSITRTIFPVISDFSEERRRRRRGRGGGGEWERDDREGQSTVTHREQVNTVLKKNATLSRLEIKHFHHIKPRVREC